MNLTVISLLKDFHLSCIKSYESLYSQTSKEFEHIIIYKNLTNENLTFLKEKFHKSQFIKEIPNEHKNKFFAMNQAIKNSNGKYIMLLHSDDIICDKDLLIKIYNLKMLDLDFITTGVKIINTEGKILRKWIFNQNKDFFGYSDIPPHTGFIYKRKLHDIFGYYSLDYPICADFDFMLRYFSSMKNKAKFKVINTYSINMLFGGDSTNLRNIFKVFNEDRLIFKSQRKNFPFLRSIKKKIGKIKQFK